jgi:hypothetical protein
MPIEKKLKFLFNSLSANKPNGKILAAKLCWRETMNLILIELVNY